MGSNSSKLEDDLRENKRRVNRTIRALERQKLSSERQEENLVLRLKAEARAGRMSSVRLVAKDVLRNRKMGKHYENMRAQMMALQSQLQTAHSANVMSNHFKNVSDLMTQVNCNTNVPEFQKIMSNIAKQGDILNLKLDMMGEAMDDTLFDGNDSAENTAVDNLLEELGVKVEANLDDLSPPQNRVPVQGNQKLEAEPVGAGYGSEEKLLELEQRISNLKK